MAELLQLGAEQINLIRFDLGLGFPLLFIIFERFKFYLGLFEKQVSFFRRFL